jgi:hypothetical protein
MAEVPIKLFPTLADSDPRSQIQNRLAMPLSFAWMH